MNKLLYAVLVLSLLLVACGGDSEPVSEPMETATIPPPTATPEPEISARTAAILEQGVVQIGVNADPLAPFTTFDGSDYVGFEIDLAKEITQRLFADAVEIEWVPLTAQERLTAVKNNDIDMLIRATTHTTSRDDSALWTSNYFLDGQRLLVGKESGITGVQDLDGHPVCVALGTHWEGNLETAVSEHGATITPIELGMGEAFMNGDCDAISTDWSLLLAQGLATGLIGDETAPTIIVGDIFSSMTDGKEAGREPFAIAVSLDDVLFRDEVDAALLAVVDDGTWQTLYDQWFPAPPPWNIEEVLTMPPAGY